MNNKNKILIGCLALLLTLSIGYALFSDTITINGTATAKGNFQLTTTCDMDVSSMGLGDYGSVTDAKITCENNVVNASATLGYPGSEKWFRVMVKNTGTIPAKLKQVTELNNPDLVYCNKDECVNEIQNAVSNVNNTNFGFATLYVDFSVYEDYSTEALGFDYFFETEHFNSVLDPGETAYYYIYTTWDSSSTESGDPLTIPLNVKLDWEQVTVE